MRILKALLVGLSILVVATGAAAISGYGEPMSETKDRLPPEMMEELVAGPIKVVRISGLSAGKAAFEKLLADALARYGPKSAQVADLFTSFGVQLYIEGLDSDDRALQQASVDFLREAVTVGRGAFGAAHPEVAVALTSYADVLLELHKPEIPAAAEAALNEALGIRSKSLGPDNPETRYTKLRVVEMNSRPERIQGDEQRLREAAAEFEKIAINAPNDPAARESSAPMIRFALARMYARNGLSEKAVEEAKRALDQLQSWPAEQRCVSSNLALMRLAEELREHGGDEHAEALSGGNTLMRLLSCMSAPDEPESREALLQIRGSVH